MKNVIGTMCMMKRRYPASLKTVDSLEGQVDKLYLCLNDFWEVPNELKRDWIEILHLGKNLGDAARFYILRNLGEVDSDVISCDDDIIYPKTYVDDFLKWSKEKPGSVLTHHGKIITPYKHTTLNGKKYAFNRGVMFGFENKEIVKLRMPGSGVSFIPKEVFNDLYFTGKVSYNQSDVHLDCQLKKNNVDVYGLPHEKGYLLNVEHPDGYSIWATVTSKEDWFSKVLDIWESYNIEFTHE